MGERCWKYDWVIEFDIHKAFDELDWSLLLRAVRKHVKERWAVLYIERWLKAPFVKADGTLVPRNQGVPQGSVIGPVMMNLFMHYCFDRWMQEKHPYCPFARYADDAVVHCSSQLQAQWKLKAIGQRLEQCGLRLNLIWPRFHGLFTVSRIGVLYGHEIEVCKAIPKGISPADGRTTPCRTQHPEPLA
jgi:RNA-directed DNA polymerase